MTHEYTLLLGGIVRPAARAPGITALAYAHDTVIAVGSDVEIRAISRGDSHLVELAGMTVLPADGVVLEPGSPASFRVVGAAGEVVAIVVDGRVVEGRFPGMS